jgi:hypothetical protein
MGRFLVFSVPDVTCNFQNPSRPTLFPALCRFLPIPFLALKEAVVYPGSLTKSRNATIRSPSLEELAGSLQLYLATIWLKIAIFVWHPFVLPCAVTIAPRVVLLLQSDHNRCHAQWVSAARNTYTMGCLTYLYSTEWVTLLTWLLFPFRCLLSAQRQMQPTFASIQQCVFCRLEFWYERHKYQIPFDLSILAMNMGIVFFTETSATIKQTSQISMLRIR